MPRSAKRGFEFFRADKKIEYGLHRIERIAKTVLLKDGFCVAPRLGFEPRYTAPEAVVLPLDDLGIMSNCGQIVSNMCEPVKPSKTTFIGLTAPKLAILEALLCAAPFVNSQK